MYASWTAPLPNGETSEELALIFDQKRSHRLLILPPWFDEHNKTRRHLVEMMRRLDLGGIDCFLPDLPGCNESLASLDWQSVSTWKEAALIAAEHFSATHVLAVRGGALITPPHLPVIMYAPQKGKQLLNGLLRARIIASQEAGRSEKREDLLEQGIESGLILAGYSLGPRMIQELSTAEADPNPDTIQIAQSDVGGSPLWLRAEPDDDPEQADALTALLTAGIMGA